MSTDLLAGLRPGDKVRVRAEFEAEVLAEPDIDGDVSVKIDGLDGRGWIFKEEVESLDVEITRIIPPKYKVGDLVLDGADDPGVVVEVDTSRPDSYRVFDPADGSAIWWFGNDVKPREAA